MEASFIDTESGLEWVIKTHKSEFSTWDQVKEIVLDNPSWRMPKIQEVLTLIDMGDYAMLKHIEFCQITFWLDHQEYKNSQNAYTAAFDNGDIYRSNKQNKRNIVLVREIQ